MRYGVYVSVDYCNMNEVLLLFIDISFSKWIGLLVIWVNLNYVGECRIEKIIKVSLNFFVM